MRLDWIADELRDDGLSVVEHTGWASRTMRPFDQFTPVGVIDHHTAGSGVIPNYPDPPFYRDTALENKCNLTIRPDGVVVCLNAGYAYDSGLGLPVVLDAVREDRELPDLSGYRAIDSDLSGNQWFIDIEVQHLGNGDPIEPVQLEALVRCNAVICTHYDWNPLFRVIGHREWSPKRKTDPRWNGDENPMPGIREATAERMGLVAQLSDGAANTAELLHAAFEKAPIGTRELILDRLIADGRADIITRSELVAYVKGALANVGGGATVEQVLTELADRIDNG